MGKRERDKGLRGMRALNKIINDRLGLDVHCGAQSRKGSDDPDCKGLSGWWIEHKECKLSSPIAALAQAVVESHRSGGFDLPIAIIHDTGKSRFCVMRFLEFDVYFAGIVKFDSGNVKPFSLSFLPSKDVAFFSGKRPNVRTALSGHRVAFIRSSGLYGVIYDGVSVDMSYIVAFDLDVWLTLLEMKAAKKV